MRLSAALFSLGITVAHHFRSFVRKIRSFDGQKILKLKVDASETISKVLSAVQDHWYADTRARKCHQRVVGEYSVTFSSFLLDNSQVFGQLHV